MTGRAVNLVIPDAASMQHLGQRMASHLTGGDVVLLHGDLGAGKTTLTQGIAAGLGVTGAVASPTFTLANEYRGRIPLRHVDLYRLREEEVADLGFVEWMDDPATVTVVEWPERAVNLLPVRYVLVEIIHGEPGSRIVTLTPVGEFPWLGQLAEGA